MKQFQNGDRCPCCGTILKGKAPRWLWLFSVVVDMIRIPPWEANPLNEEDVSKR